MSEAMTVQDLIQQQMEFAQYFTISLAAIAALVFFISFTYSAIESRRIWKELRKLEKEKLEKELETSKKDENGSVMILTPDDPLHGSKLINSNMLKDRLQKLYDEDDHVEWCNAIAEVLFILDNEF